MKRPHRCPKSCMPHLDGFLQEEDRDEAAEQLAAEPSEPDQCIMGALSLDARVSGLVCVGVGGCAGLGSRWRDISLHQHARTRAILCSLYFCHSTFKRHIYLGKTSHMLTYAADHGRSPSEEPTITVEY